MYFAIVVTELREISKNNLSKGCIILLLKKQQGNCMVVIVMFFNTVNFLNHQYSVKRGDNRRSCDFFSEKKILKMVRFFVSFLKKIYFEQTYPKQTKILLKKKKNVHKFSIDHFFDDENKDCVTVKLSMMFPCCS